MNDETSRAWNYYIHFDNLITSRANFFLVAEAMLVAAFVTVPGDDIYLHALIGTLALIYTASWFYLNDRLAKRKNVFWGTVKQDPLMLSFLEAAGGLNVRIVLGYILPLSTLLFWLSLLLWVFLNNA